MTDETSSGFPAKGRLRRPLQDRVLGGVCAAVARSLGVEPVLVRLSAVALAVVSGGSAVLGYLIAWALIPQEQTGPAVSDDRTAAARGVMEPTQGVEDAALAVVRQPCEGGARWAWSAVGDELRALARELRPVPDPARPSAATGRSPVDAVDSVLTGVGERLRDPAVQESARRTVAQLAAAVSASAEAVGQGTRRSAADADSPADERTDQGSAPTDAVGPDAVGPEAAGRAQ